MLALLAAVIYASYTVTLRVMIPADAESGMFLFFGYLGIINVVLWFPFLMLLEVSGSISLTTMAATPIALAFVKGTDL